MTTLYSETSTDRLRELVEQAQAVIRAVAEQSAADQRSFEEGYRLGFQSGFEVGRIAAEKSEEERATNIAALIGKTTRTRTLEELNELRGWNYTREQMQKLRGRDRFPLSDRLCFHCDGRGYIPGGVA